MTDLPVSAFPILAAHVHKRFKAMSESELYVVELSRDDTWAEYLASFPEGTDPIFRERTEHDCSCCRHFVKNIGNVVAIDGVHVRSVWDDGDDLPFPYNRVAAQMSATVRSKSIRSIFRTIYSTFGETHTRELIDGKLTTFDHFYANTATRHKRPDPLTEVGKAATSAAMFKRALSEITLEAINDVLELIDSGHLYRGTEHKTMVKSFLEFRNKYVELVEWGREIFIWQHVDAPAARIRNTVIGTLLVDLSEGVELEKAVKAFETKVAPQNYKRPTALITPRMIENAVKKLSELGLESAIERRFAKLSDVSVNNVLFVDNATAPKMRDGIAGLLMDEAAVKPVEVDNAESIRIDDFVNGVLPHTKSVDLVIDNKQLGNFVSVTTSAVAGSANLFKWNNPFAWSYDGGAADSIKQRVKKAGGNVDAKHRVSLAWFNTDDLDIHVKEPNGNHISFSNKCGKLDVDMNVYGERRDAVENVCWHSLDDGPYTVSIDNYTQREDIDVGFELEVETGGVTTTYTYARRVVGEVVALTLSVVNGEVTHVETHSGVHASNNTKEKWGVYTHQLTRVSTLMNSPNFWDDQSIGNKHWFFILDECRNPDPARGIYNEFLRGDLEEHRKVFEVLGAKTKCTPTADQLSGVGFSSARNDECTVVVKGSINKAFKLQF